MKRCEVAYEVWDCVCSNGGMIGASSTRLRRTENILGLLSRMSLWIRIRIRIRTSTVIFILIIHYIYIMNMPYIVAWWCLCADQATNRCTVRNSVADYWSSQHARFFNASTGVSPARRSHHLTSKEVEAFSQI